MTILCKCKRRSQSVAWRACESAREDPSPCVFKLTWTLLPHPTPPIPTLTAQHTFHACATWHERYCPTPPHQSPPWLHNIHSMRVPLDVNVIAPPHPTLPPPHITDMHIVLRVSRGVHGFRNSGLWYNELFMGIISWFINQVLKDHRRRAVSGKRVSTPSRTKSKG